MKKISLLLAFAFMISSIPLSLLTQSSIAAESKMQPTAYLGDIFFLAKTKDVSGFVPDSLKPKKGSLAPADPDVTYVYLKNKYLVVDGDGKIDKIVDDSKKLTTEVKIVNYSGQLIMPGFVDTHVHYPQVEMIGAPGSQLLAWLKKYVFETERKYQIDSTNETTTEQSKAYIKKAVQVFLDELARNGTTSALVFPSLFPASVRLLFDEAQNRNMRLITGKVMMDRGVPKHFKDSYLQKPEDDMKIQKGLIDNLANRPSNRLGYAIIPRFAPTSTNELLQAAQQLKSYAQEKLKNKDKKIPSVWVHTHLNESRAEVLQVQAYFKDFPPFKDRKSFTYTDVYHAYGLVDENSIFAHGVQTTDAEFATLKAAGAAIAFCPTSNLFLGSGLFDLAKAKAMQLEVGLGTDVGAGTSLSQFRTLNEAYKVLQLRKGDFYDLDDCSFCDVLKDSVCNAVKQCRKEIVVNTFQACPNEKICQVCQECKNPNNSAFKETMKNIQSQYDVFNYFYLATLGGAEALSLQDEIGTFKQGAYADFIIIDWTPTPLFKYRMKAAENRKEVAKDGSHITVKDFQAFQDKLFALMTLGDDRNITATYIAGTKIDLKK